MQKDIKFSPPVIKLSMPVPPSQELRGKGLEQGIVFDPEGAELPQDLSIATAVKDAGLSKFCLPKIHYVEPKMVRTINGKLYLIITIEPPKDYKRIPKEMVGLVIMNPDGKTGRWPGLIRAINLETGLPEAFTCDEVYEQIRTKSEEWSEKTRIKTNEGIRKHNANRAKIDLATASLNNLPQQLTHVKIQVDERIKILNDIIQGLNQQVEKEPQKPEVLVDWEKYIDDRIGSGSLEESDLTDHILAKYQYRYHELAQDLESNKLVIPSNIANPEAYKQKLLTIVNIVLEKMRGENEKQREKEREKAARPPFNIANQPEIPLLQELQPGEVPSKHKSTGYFSWESRGYSKQHGIEGSQKDKDELSSISTALADIGEEIGKLRSADKKSDVVSERSYDFLTTPEGQPLVEKFKRLFNEGMGKFTERYSKDLVDEQGRLDPRKFSRSGDMGNVGLVVSFTQLYQVLALVFKKAGLPPPVEPIPGAETVATPQDRNISQVPPIIPGPSIQAKSKMVIKISKSEWLAMGKKGKWL